MRRTDHIFVYYDPIDNKRHCRICSAATGSIGTVCYVCVQKDNDYKCCSHSNNGRWTENFKFDNTIRQSPTPKGVGMFREGYGQLID